MAYRSILLTGGTGSFGKAFIRRIINSKSKPERLVIFSRDELKQYEMKKHKAIWEIVLKFGLKFLISHLLLSNSLIYYKY